MTIWKGFGSYRKVRSGIHGGIAGIKVESAPRSRNSGLDTGDSPFGYIAEAHESGDIWPCLDQITTAATKHRSIEQKQWQRPMVKPNFIGKTSLSNQIGIGQYWHSGKGRVCVYLCNR